MKSGTRLPNEAPEGSDMETKLDIESQQDAFDESPQGWAKRWAVEISAAKERLEKWHKRADEIVKIFLDQRETKAEGTQRLNLFTANVQTLRALLFGKVPSVDVDRRFSDFEDPVARVAGEILERILNTDLERSDDDFRQAMSSALDDRLIAGYGNVWLRYEADFEEQAEVAATKDEQGNVLAEAYQPPAEKSREDVAVDYVYWKDQLWSPCRTFAELRWMARKAYMTRDQLVERFPKVGKQVPLNAKRASKEDTDYENSNADPWARSEVWEIWSSEYEKVFWFVEGFGQILDVKDDPLELENFWPFPRPLMANLTTSAMIPFPDYAVAQDLYKEIDNYSTRICLLTRAIQAKGVYDENCAALKKLLQETTELEMLPVAGWPAFQEKGGLQGAVAWLPINEMVAALQVLTEKRQEAIGLLYQVTGMSDIMRGQAAQATTATEQAIKARFASVRIQSFQDEFARFASEVQSIKAEIISKHFDPQTIIERSNVAHTPDAQIASQAVQLIKDQFPNYRITVRPESVSLTDYAALKQERVEWSQALASFIQSVVPMVQLMPQSLPFLLQMLQWTMAGFKGSNQIEGVLDQAIAAAQQMVAQQEAAKQQAAQQPSPPDPKLQAAQVKGKMDQQKVVLEHQADMQRIGAEAQAEMATDKNRFTLDVAQEEHKQQMAGVAALRNATTPGIQP
jgi:hypothetical protein